MIQKITVFLSNQKLLHGSTTKSESNHRSGPALSFLDQIKAKRGGLAIDAVETASTASSVNFLDAIKNSRRRIEE